MLVQFEWHVTFTWIRENDPSVYSLLASCSNLFLEWVCFGIVLWSLSRAYSFTKWCISAIHQGYWLGLRGSTLAPSPRICSQSALGSGADLEQPRAFLEFSPRGIKFWDYAPLKNFYSFPFREWKREQLGSARSRNNFLKLGVVAPNRFCGQKFVPRGNLHD